jgi:cytochrome c5
VSGPISKSDQTLRRQFSIMIGSLVLITVLLFLGALTIYRHEPKETNPNESTTIAERIAPAGAVYAGNTGRAAMQAAAEAATKAAASSVAYGGTTDGKAIFNHLCTSCHTAGIAGAPKVGNKSMWAPRIAQGIDTLVKHAINGYHGPDGNYMPAKGGNPALTDEQVSSAVHWMVAQVK